MTASSQAEGELEVRQLVRGQPLAEAAGQPRRPGRRCKGLNPPRSGGGRACGLLYDLRRRR
jgi:hypothetical protein